MITPQNPAVLVRDFKTEQTFIIRGFIGRDANPCCECENLRF
jgi:hypothetical protein